jgi:hypothetical protein
MALYVHLATGSIRGPDYRMAGASEAACGRAVYDASGLTTEPRAVTCPYCEAVVRGVRPKQVMDEHRRAREEREAGQAEAVRQWKAGEKTYLEALSRLVQLGLPLWKADYLLEQQKEQKA